MEETTQKSKSNVSTIIIIVLLVIGFCIGITICVTVALLAINPSKNLSMARNAQRKADIFSINNALMQYQVDSDSEIKIDNVVICNEGTTPIGKGLNNADLSIILVPEYIVEIPHDPSSTETLETGYTICQNGVDGNFVIEAPKAELGEKISTGN